MTTSEELERASEIAVLILQSRGEGLLMSDLTGEIEEETGFQVSSEMAQFAVLSLVDEGVLELDAKTYVLRPALAAR